LGGEGEEEHGRRQESSGGSGEKGVRVWLVAPFYSFQYQYESLNQRSMVTISWAIWDDVGFSVYHFSFSFSFLLHHCEVTLKNNYVIYTNIFFIYNSMDTSFHLGVSRFFEWIRYFLSFK
jgi:hypothetical protein